MTRSPLYHKNASHLGSDIYLLSSDVESCEQISAIEVFLLARGVGMPGETVRCSASSSNSLMNSFLPKRGRLSLYYLADSKYLLLPHREVFLTTAHHIGSYQILLNAAFKVSTSI